MPSSVLTSWWGRQSDPDRIELYTLWTFYSVAALMAPIAAVVAHVVVEPPWSYLMWLLHLGQAVVVGIACAQSLDWVLDRREEPRPARLANAAFAVGLILLTFGLFAADRIDAVPHLNSLLILTLAPGFLAATICLKTTQIVQLITATALLITGLTLLAGGSVSAALGIGLAAAFTSTAVSFTGRFSVWMLAVVRELDEARHIQGRLAVAEERLRFARDLHDVLGRNLSVIALKSELAVQLAQRQEEANVRTDKAGKGGSIVLDQLVEVQRIARESQGELREVVRGYRDTGLRTELAGARGVLRAAGVDCQVDSASEDALSPAVQTALGWVVREATTNVLRHSEASHCAIELDTTNVPGTAVLTVTNDGARGGRSGGHVSGGTGLAGLRERLTQLGGVLTVGHGEADDLDGQSDEAARGGGTFTLRVEVPVTATAAEGAARTRERRSGE